MAKNVDEEQYEKELDKIVKEKWTADYRKGYVSVKGCMLPENYLKIQKSVEDFEVFDSDIWICSYPRTGTTWTSEMVWLIANDCDHEKAKIPIFDRVRFLELSCLVPVDKISHQSKSDSVGYTKSQPHPRFIKSHLPLTLLPKQIEKGQRKPKIIYVCRNPLDNCVSYYHFMASNIFSGTMEEFCKLYLSKKIMYGSYWDHVLAFWKLKDQPNVLFLKYEDLKYNLLDVIRRTANFLGKSVSQEQGKNLQEHLSFESMKKNSAIGAGTETIPKSSFVRAGIVGGYKKEMPEEFVEIFKNWMKTHLEGTGLNFHT